MLPSAAFTQAQAFIEIMTGFTLSLCKSQQVRNVWCISSLISRPVPRCCSARISTQ